MLIKTFLSLLSIIFSILMIYITQLNFKKKILSNFLYLVWLFVWISIIFVSIRPKYIDEYFYNNFKIDIFYILSVSGIIILVILYYFSLIKIRILEKKINLIVRAESLKKILGKIEKE